MEPIISSSGLPAGEFTRMSDKNKLVSIKVILFSLMTFILVHMFEYYSIYLVMIYNILMSCMLFDHITKKTYDNKKDVNKYDLLKEILSFGIVIIIREILIRRVMIELLILYEFNPILIKIIISSIWCIPYNLLWTSDDSWTHIVFRNVKLYLIGYVSYNLYMSHDIIDSAIFCYIYVIIEYCISYALINPAKNSSCVYVRIRRASHNNINEWPVERKEIKINKLYATWTHKFNKNFDNNKLRTYFCDLFSQYVPNIGPIDKVIIFTTIITAIISNLFQQYSPYTIIIFNTIVQYFINIKRINITITCKELIKIIVLFGIIMPIIEELLFRENIIRLLIWANMNNSSIKIISSLIFSIVHIDNYFHMNDPANNFSHTFYQVIMAYFVGNICYDLHKYNVIYAIAFHCLINTYMLIVFIIIKLIRTPESIGKSNECKYINVRTRRVSHNDLTTIPCYNLCHKVKNVPGIWKHNFDKN